MNLITDRLNEIQYNYLKPLESYLYICRTGFYTPAPTKSVLSYSIYCLSVTHVNAHLSETYQDIAMKLLEYVGPNQHFV